LDPLTQPDRTPLEFGPRTVVLASLAAWAVITLVGSVSDICLGDEPEHIRTVRLYAKHHARVPYDPLFRNLKQARCGLMATPLWHGLLAGLWDVTGTSSQTLAQAYHAGFYLLLLLAVYYGARAVWGTAAATWAWLIAATMPMICVYSVLLYQDVPGLAVSAVGFLLVWRKRFFWSGVAFGAAYLTKMNMLSFAPWAVAFAAAWSGGSWARRARAAALVALPLVTAFGYDLAWRWEAFGKTATQLTLDAVLRGPLPLEVKGLSSQALAALKRQPQDYTIWKPYPVYRPTSLVSHLGLAFVIGCPLAVWRVRDGPAKWLWACFAAAAAAWFLVFIVWAGDAVQTRYTLPMVLVLLFLVGAGLAQRPLARWQKALIVAGCVAQAAAALAYLHHGRQISEPEEAAYAWIQTHTPPEAPIMTPERILTIRTGRPSIWSTLNPPYLLTEAPHAIRRELLHHFGVSHVLIHRRRLYDRSTEGSHHGGFPREFLAEVREAPYLETVYENAAVILLRVRTPEQEPEPPPTGGGPDPGAR